MYKRRLSPLDVVSPECYALCHPLLPRSDALLEGFSRDPFQLRCRGAFYLVHILKTGPLDDPLEFGEEKKITRSQIRRVGGLLQHRDPLLGQKLSDTQSVVSRRVVMVKQSRVGIPHLSPLDAH